MSKVNDLIKELCSDGVEYKRICDICNVVGRIGFRGYKREDQVEKGNGAISLSPSNIINGKINYNDCTYINWDKYNESPEIMVNDGDVIFCKTASVGKTCYIENMPEKTTINPQLILLKNISINAKYLSYCLQTEDFQNKANSIKGLGTIPTLSQKDFNELTIPVPPLEVQEEIVRILDKFGELEAELKAELKARKNQYEFWRGKLLNEEYETKYLPELSTNLDNKRKPVTKTNRESGGYPYYGASGIVDYVSGYIFDDELLLVSEDGANLKARSTPIAFSSSGKVWINNHAHVLKFNSMITQKYVEHYLNMIDLSEYITGAAQPKLNQENLNKIRINIPSSIEEQEKIVIALERFDRLINDISVGLPAEIELRRKQYEYYRNKLLSFEEYANE